MKPRDPHHKSVVKSLFAARRLLTARHPAAAGFLLKSSFTIIIDFFPINFSLSETLETVRLSPVARSRERGSIRPVRSPLGKYIGKVEFPMIRKDEKTAVIEANRTHPTDTG